MDVVAEALQGVGVVRLTAVEPELAALVVEPDLLQHAHIAQLAEPLAQQHVLQLVRPSRLAVEIGLGQGAGLQAEFVDTPAGAAGAYLKEQGSQPALLKLFPGSGEEVEVAAHRVGEAVDQGFAKPPFGGQQ